MKFALIDSTGRNTLTQEVTLAQGEYQLSFEYSAKENSLGG